LESVFLNFSSEECIKRVKNRKNHPTLKPEKADEVVNDFLKSFHSPKENEYFSKFHEAKSEKGISLL
jgi:hypothetical protein